AEMKHVLETTANLDLRQAMVERILPPAAEVPHTDSHVQRNPHSFAVVTHTGRIYQSHALILTTGTFLRGRAITGSAIWGAGRAGEAPAVALGEDLAGLGFPLVRLKTGTPPRIDARTIDFSAADVQHGSHTPRYFGHYYPEYTTDAVLHPPMPAYHGPPAAVFPAPMVHGWRAQLPCYLVHTTPQFHAIVQANIDRAPLFSGVIEGVGPRYCPSIEDKIMRFSDKERHGMFLEPEGWATSEVYVQGCNTSLPEDVQWAMLRSVPALRQVELMRAGYAIEYDAVATGEIAADLGARRLRGLFLAGQINGTTGYEEAAAQGLIAGINAARFIRQQPPVILRRDEAYIGVLIDDLVTKEIREPYRMFTSRAEHRLLLRSDNADLRLTPLAATLGLIDSVRSEAVEQKRHQVASILGDLRRRRVYPSAITNTQLEAAGLPTITIEMSTEDLLRRPDVDYHRIQPLFDLPPATSAVIEQVEIEARYASYFEKQQREIERIQRMETRRIPQDFDYDSVRGMRNEARQVLKRFQPATIGQASRLAGVNPTDIAILVVALERRAAETSDQPA
ncbi:MAG TPA: FAD-dependent oxidoreductase, partial [Roseiflexaceae bacterium]|nr:FAD-dependent oxidoreductase [Roseiflexaceae bacterium]